MNNLNNPRWIIAINTLPSLLLMIILYKVWMVVHTQVPQQSLDSWNEVAIGIGLLTIANLYYWFLMIRKGLRVSPYFSIGSLILYIIGISLYSFRSFHLVPSSIPRWMVPENIDMYVAGLVMPTLLYHMAHLVTWASKNRHSTNHHFNLLYAGIIPVVMYVFGQVITPLWNPFRSDFGEHVLVVLVVCCCVLFLFFVILWGQHIILAKKVSPVDSLAYRIVLGIFFPILGLALNQGLVFDLWSPPTGGVFGDFGHPLFFALAILNGVLVVMPDRENPRYMLVRYIGRALLFSYIAYFMLVFMPFLPLSFIVIIVFGLGFLMLTPLLLFYVQCKDLVEDWKYLRQYTSKLKLSAISILCLCAVPSAVVLDVLLDRVALHESLEYIYGIDQNKNPKIDTKALSKVLHNVRANKGRRSRDIMDRNQVPYFSALYNWLVLDNLTLSRRKINELENVYLGTNHFISLAEDVIPTEVKITDLETNSTYNQEKGEWTSWVDIELSNKTNRRLAEYITHIDLPNGCWISDYYLYVGDRKEKGILTDKKSAIWVYNQIRNTNRDPGLLHYKSGNEVTFKVFPFAAQEVRKTGIQFIHKDPVIIDIDGSKVELGDNDRVGRYNNKVSNEQMNTVLVTSEEKKNLKSVTRRPYFHFIVNASANSALTPEDAIEQIELMMDQFPSHAKDSRISLTNYRSESIELKGNWHKSIRSHDYEGGFYLEKEMTRIFADSYHERGLTYPVVVVVADSLPEDLINLDFKDIKIAFPDNHYFYRVHEGEIDAHNLMSHPFEKDKIQTINQTSSVLAWPNSDDPIAYLPIEEASSIVIRNVEKRLSSKLNKDWNSALQLHGEWIAQRLRKYPRKDDWLQLIKGSFQTRIMTPLTSYMVVETEAQKVVLKRKQDQVLNGNQHLDVGSEARRMSEPRIWMVVLLFLLFMLWKRRRSYQLTV